MEANVLTMSNAFSFKRFVSYFNLYITANRRRLLLSAVQIFIFTFILILLFLYTQGINSYEEYQSQRLDQPLDMSTDYEYEFATLQVTDPFWTMEIPGMVFLSFIFMMFSGSWMFRSMIDKKDRLNTIEIPATQGEKILVWWCLSLPVALITLLVGFWLADLIRVLWVKVFTPYGNFAHPLPVVNILKLSLPALDNADAPGLTGSWACVIYSLLAITNALFALGSILFHRMNFLKTMIAGFLLFGVFSVLFIIGRISFFGNIDLITIKETINLSIFGGSIFAIAFLIYLFTYFRLKEEDIINKW